MHNQAKYEIVIVRSSSIGDVILCTSILNAITNLGLDIKVHWLTKSFLIPLLNQNYPKHSFLDIEKITPDDFNTLKNSKILFALDLQQNIRSKNLLRQIKSAGIQTYKINKGRLNRAKILLKSRLSKRKNISPKNLLEFELVHKKNTRVFLEILKNHIIENFDIEATVKKSRPLFLSTTKNKVEHLTIAVAPGASFAPKQAPHKLFSESIIKYLKLVNKTHPNKTTLYFLGDKSDLKAIEEITKTLGPQGIQVILAGKLELEENQPYLEKSMFLLCNDSGLAHMAEATSTPVISFFGPTNEKLGFAPSLPKSRIFTNNLSCSPCSKHGARPCRYLDYLCYSGVDTDKVASYMHSITRAK